MLLPFALLLLIVHSTRADSVLLDKTPFLNMSTIEWLRGQSSAEENRPDQPSADVPRMTTPSSVHLVRLSSEATGAKKSTDAPANKQSPSTPRSSGPFLFPKSTEPPPKQEERRVTAAHDEANGSSMGPWRLVTPDTGLSIAGKRLGHLHRHKSRSSTQSTPSTDVESQLTLEGGDEDAAAQGSSSGSPTQENSEKPAPKGEGDGGEVKGEKDKGDEPAAKSTETEIEISEPTAPVKPHYKLIYFDARGICEAIRLLFRYANQTFVDERISKKKWIAIKDTTFYGKIPILEVDGKPLAQCYAISRYLAKQFGLAGADDWESAKLDEAADFHKGVHNEISPYIFVLSGYRHGEKDLLRKDLFIPTVEKTFPVYVNLLKQSASGYFGKSGVSWVDFVVSEYMTTIAHYEPLIMEKYPVITRFIDKIQALPQIKDYIKQRTKTPLQVQYLL